MLKQIHIKSIKNEVLLKRMYDEASNYLESIGFKKTPLLSVTDAEVTFRGFLFASGNEKVMIEYQKNLFEEVLKLVFAPMEIKFIYDILLMRINQIASDERDSVFIYTQN